MRIRPACSPMKMRPSGETAIAVGLMMFCAMTVALNPAGTAAETTMGSIKRIVAIKIQFKRTNLTEVERFLLLARHNDK
jgi:hypothetical protein